jgi:nicotinic acid mononucleotide adenylyltransferase
MTRTQTTTPIHVIEAKLNELKEHGGDDSKKTKVVLISTGSYNPVHRVHVETFKISKTQLEQKHNMIVVGAFLSPSNDSYVSSKLGKEFIEAKHRLEMCELAVKEANMQDWLIVDRWESSQTRFIDFPGVHSSLATYISTAFPNDNIRVMYLCGTDHLMRCGGLASLRKPSTGVVALKRPGFENVKSDANLLVVNNTSYDTDFSSTMIRKRIKQGLDYGDLAYSSVVGYLKENCSDYLQ